MKGLKYDKYDILNRKQEFLSCFSQRLGMSFFMGFAMIAEKKCSACKVVKPITSFHISRRSADGYLGSCRSCRKLKRKGEYKKYKVRKANFLKTPKGREYTKRRYRTARAKYPQKYIAYAEYGYALAIGKIKKQPCEVCGINKVDGHHDDYYKPLDVKWLCRKHHKEYHRKQEVGENGNGSVTTQTVFTRQTLNF